MISALDSYLAGNRRIGHETRNILQLMRNTAGGPAEVGGLAVADVQLSGDIPFVWFRENAIRTGLVPACADQYSFSTLVESYWWVRSSSW